MGIQTEEAYVSGAPLCRETSRWKPIFDTHAPGTDRQTPWSSQRHCHRAMLRLTPAHHDKPTRPSIKIRSGRGQTAFCLCLSDGRDISCVSITEKCVPAVSTVFFETTISHHREINGGKSPAIDSQHAARRGCAHRSCRFQILPQVFFTNHVLLTACRVPLPH